MKFKQISVACCYVIFLLSMLITYQLYQASPKKIKPYVLCTTTIIADAVKNIGQDTIEVISLMGPGIDPHGYKPVESDVIKIASADVIFYNGLDLEAKLADILEQLAAQQTTIAVTKDIPRKKLLCVDEYNSIFDPHVWFDINLWIYAINTISKTLIKKFPAHKKLYKLNTKIYIAKLRKLLTDTQKIISTIPTNKRVVITGHDAFSYFGKLYQCKVIGLQGISTESCPGAYDIQALVRVICDSNIPAIFIESSTPIKNITALQEGVAAYGKKINCGGELYSDALGQINSCGSTYIDMIIHNVRTIAHALQKE